MSCSRSRATHISACGLRTMLSTMSSTISSTRSTSKAWPSADVGHELVEQVRGLRSRPRARAATSSSTVVWLSVGLDRDAGRQQRGARLEFLGRLRERGQRHRVAARAPRAARGALPKSPRHARSRARPSTPSESAPGIGRRGSRRCAAAGRGARGRPRGGSAGAARPSRASLPARGSPRGRGRRGRRRPRHRRAATGLRRRVLWPRRRRGACHVRERRLVLVAERARAIDHHVLAMRAQRGGSGPRPSIRKPCSRKGVSTHGRSRSATNMPTLISAARTLVAIGPAFYAPGGQARRVQTKASVPAGKCERLGNARARAASSRPNQRASVAPYWSTEVVGIQRPSNSASSGPPRTSAGVGAVQRAAAHRAAEDEVVVAPCVVACPRRRRAATCGRSRTA